MKRTIPIMIILGLLLLCLPMAAAAEEPIPLIPNVDTDGVTWTGKDDTDGWTLTISNDASGNSYNLSSKSDIKINKIKIEGNDISINGNNTKITSDFNGAGLHEKFVVTGNNVILDGWDIDFSKVVYTGTEKDRRSMIAVFINGSNAIVSNSTITAGKSEGSSSQAIVISKDNTIVKDSTLTAKNSLGTGSGSVGVRFSGAANNTTLDNISIIANTVDSNRNVGISWDGVTESSTTTLKGNTLFDIANSTTDNKKEAAAFYISPKKDDLTITIISGDAFVYTYKDEGAVSPKNLIYIDSVDAGDTLKNVTLSGNLNGSDKDETPVFLDYDDGLNVIFEDMDVSEGNRATIPKTIKVAGDVMLSNLTFTNATSMIEPLGGSTLTVTDSVLGVAGKDSKHGIKGNNNYFVKGVNVTDNTFEGNFRKGMLLYTAEESKVDISNNTFNGFSHNWGDKKSSVMTVVGNESSVTTFENNTVSKYYKVLSIDNTPKSLTNAPKWIIENNTFDDIEYVLDINGENDHQNTKGEVGSENITMADNFVKNPDKESYGIAPKVLNSTPATPDEFKNPNFIYPYYYYVNGEDKKSVTVVDVQNLLETIDSLFEAEADDIIKDVKNLLETIDPTLTPDILRDHKDIVKDLETLIKNAKGFTELVNVTNDLGLNVPEITGAGIYALDGGEGDVELKFASAEPPEDAPEDAIAFSINLSFLDDPITTLTVPLFIKMEIPDEFKGKTGFVIIHYMSDGGTEEITPTIEGNYMSFAVTKLSTFALTGGSTPSKGGGGSGTGAAKVVDGNNTTYVPPVIDDGDNDGDGSGTGDAKPGNNTTNTTPKPTTPKDEGSSSSLMWILIVGAIIVIAAVAFFLYKRNK